jgi:hypothetical protein
VQAPGGIRSFEVVAVRYAWLGSQAPSRAQ